MKLGKIFLILLFCCSAILAAEKKEINKQEYELYQKVEQLVKNQQQKEAIETLTQYATDSKKPLHPALLGLRANAHIDLLQFKEAIKDLKTLQEIEPNETTMLNIGLCYLQAQEPYMAEIAFKQGLLEAEKPYFFKRGILESTLAQQKYEESLSLLQSLKTEKPDDSKLLFLEAQLLYQQGKLKDAYVKLILLHQLEPVESEQILQMLIDLSLHLGLAEEADQRLQQLIKKNINQSSKIKSLVLLYLQQEKNTKALEWLESQKPETMPDVYLYTAEAVSKTDPNKSWTLLEKIKKEQAANGRYHYLKGTVLIALDKTEEALATLHVAKTFNEYKKASLWQILKIYQAKNDKEHCLKTLQDLEELEPNNRSLKQLLKYYE